MTRVLVTGAGGFFGRTLCPALLAAGHDVSAAVRDPAAAGLGSLEIRPVPDIGPDTDWGKALSGVEAVVHLAARVDVINETAADPLAEYRGINRDGTRRLAEAAVGEGVRRLLFLSTVKVNGEKTEAAPFSENDPPAPADAYGLSKWEAEKTLAGIAAKSELETVILRSPLIYGENVKGRFLSLLKLCRKALPLPLGGIANRRSMIYAGNLADAVIRCLAHPDAAGRTYLVGDCEDVSTPELIRRVAGALGRPARLFAVPSVMLRLAGGVVGQSATVGRLLGSLQINDGRIRRELGWTPPFAMLQGMEKTAAWFLSTGRS